jgi:Transglutaminase-like superfamily
MVAGKRLGSGFGDGVLSRAPGKVTLALEVLGVYLRVRWMLVRLRPVPAVSVLRHGLDGHVMPEPVRARVRLGLSLGRAVARVLRLLPTDSRCLVQSLVLTRMLARRGVYAKLVIGVRPAPSFGAHAWVEVNGEPVLPTGESTYRRLVEL